MNSKTKNMNIIQYSKSMDKNLRLISNDKNLKELIQDMNNINKNILRYKQIENLLQYTSTSKNKEFEKKCDENILYKGALLEDMKLLQNRLYKTKRFPKVDNNIKVHKNTVKDVMRDIFGKSEAKQIRRYFPKSKVKLSHLNNLNKENLNFSERLIKRDRQSKKNICVTERNINNYAERKNETANNTIENSKNINFANYASNCVKYKHPQFYILNTNNASKKSLPPLKVNKVKMVDLLHRNNSYLKDFNKKSKFEKYMMAMQMAYIIKFKVN